MRKIYLIYHSDIVKFADFFKLISQNLSDKFHFPFLFIYIISSLYIYINIKNFWQKDYVGIPLRKTIKKKILFWPVFFLIFFYRLFLFYINYMENWFIMLILFWYLINAKNTKTFFFFFSNFFLFFELQKSEKKFIYIDFDIGV